ncbi:MAG: dihydrodipicolinate synthase family protein [Geminicoccaceae bacterium]
MTIDPADPSASLFGIIPPLTMPFDDDGELVEDALADQVNWMVEAGAAGVVVGGSTGEGHTLSGDEHAAAMHVAHDTLAGRRSLLAGLIVNSTTEAVRRARALDGLDIDALQVTPVHYLFKPGRQATIDHFRAIHEESGRPIIIYNVIPWNYLDPPSMLEIMDKVPGVIGIKQSSGDLKALADLMLELPDDRVVLTGIDALLYPSFALGAHGAITALTAALPHVTVALHKAVRSGDHETARGVHDCLLRLWNALSHDNLPACVKYIQNRQGLPFFQPRAPMDRVSEAQRKRIDRELAPMLAMLEHFGKAA